jgi:ProP effector
VSSNSLPPIEPTPTPAAPSAPETPAPEALTPAACAAQLRHLFPALFSGAVKPLKLRIQSDIQERAPGLFTKQLLSAVLRRHTGGHAYLVALTQATHRFDLDGAPAGELSAEHRQAALDELAQRRANQTARRALEDEQRHNRATLLHDFEHTTLTPANFSALKGITPEELEGYLATAREEAQMRHAQQAQRQGVNDDRPPGQRHQRGPRGPR